MLEPKPHEWATKLARKLQGTCFTLVMYIKSNLKHAYEMLNLELIVTTERRG